MALSVPATSCRLYRTAINLAYYLPCSASGQPWQPPSGYELVSMLNVTLPGGGEPVPLAAVLLNEEREQLVVIVRGTMSPQEWAVDFSYK